jgi:hypothetical protein
MDPDANPVTDDVAGIALEERLTVVRIGGDLRAQLLATLEGAGWQLVRNDDLPSPDPGFLLLDPIEPLELQLSTSRQAADLADSSLAEVLEEVSAVSAELDRSERLRAELDGLADLVAVELREARHVEDSPERIARIAEGATGLGFDALAPALSAWLTEIASGTAAPDPLATALAARRTRIAWELTEGSGSTERAPAVLDAHARRHDLRSLSVELEGMVERGLTVESRQLIESAHGERLRTEDAGGRRAGVASRDATAVEEAALARFGYASFLDYQISTSTRSVGEHAEMTLVGVRGEIEQAERDLTAAGIAAAETRTALQLELVEIEAAIAALAGDRSIEGIVARPAVFDELAEQIHTAGELAQAGGAANQARLAELQPIVDSRTQEAARAEGEVEGLVAELQDLRLDWDVAESAIAGAESELRTTLTGLVTQGPLAVDADMAWLAGDRLLAIFEEAAAGGPVVWCTDRSDVASGRALESPARWWQLRRRARHGALTS